MYAPHSSSSPQRLVAIGAVVLFHVAVIVAFKAGLVHEARELIKPITIIDVIDEELTPEPELAPPPPVDFEAPPPVVPIPDLVIDIPVEPTITTTYDKTEEPSVPATSPVSTAVRARPSAGVNLSRPDYPPVARRLGQEGTVTLKLHVLANGRIGEALIEKSSGFSKLDEAAQNHALRQWRFKPGTENGSPVAMWTSYRVVFRLDQY